MIDHNKHCMKLFIRCIKQYIRRMKQFFSIPQNQRILREATLSGIFAYMVMGLIAPFDLDQLNNIRYVYFAYISLSSITVGIISGLISTYVLKMPLDPSLPLNKVHRNAVVMQLVNAPLLAIVLTTLNGGMFCNRTADIWWYNGHIILEPYLHFLYYVIAIDIIFFIGTFIRNRNWHLHYQLDEVRAINALLEQKAEENDRRYFEKQRKEKEDEDEKENDRIRNNEGEEVGVIEGEKEGKNVGKEQENNWETKGELCLIGHSTNSELKILPSQILYVEAMANYADIWYLDQDTPTHKLLRITLKEIKKSLDSIPFMVQCHRAFIVNLNFVVTMTNRSNGYQLQIFGTEKQIPVSRSYTPQIKQKLKKAVLPRKNS